MSEPLSSRALVIARRPGFVLKCMVVLQLAIVLWQFFPQMSANGDDAAYFVLGKALAEGKGYADISAPGAPSQSLYPPAFPALLGVVSLINDTPLLAKAVVSFLAVLVTLLAYRYFRNRAPQQVFAILALLILSYQMVQFSVILMSEVPYLLCTVLALVLLDKSIHDRTNRWLFLAAIVVSVLPMESRTVGIAFSAAWVASALIQRQYRYAVWHIAAIVVVAGGLRLLTGGGASYLGPLLLRNSYNPDLGYVTATEMVARIKMNFMKYLTESVPLTFLPVDAQHNRSWLPGAGIAIMLLAAAGWIELFRRKAAILALYLMFYAGILLVWQTQWTSERFIVPVIPFVAGCILLGIELALVGGWWLLSVAARRVAPRPPRYVVPVAALLVVAMVGVVNLRAMGTLRKQNCSFTADWVNFYSCADWIRINTPRSAKVVSRKPELFFLRSKRQGVIYPFTHDVEHVVDDLKKSGATYVVYDNFFWTHTTAEYLYPVVSSHPEHFKVVYALRNPDTFVLEFLP